MWDSTAEDKRYCTENTKCKPAQSYCNTSVFGIKNFVLRFSDSQWKTYDQADNHGNQKSEKFMFLINESRDTWKNHEHCLKITHPSNDISNNSKIHLYTSLLMPEYLGYREVPYGL